MSARCGSSHGGSFRPAPERVHWLVDREAGLDGGDLKQYAARLAKIDRLEVAAVADLGHGASLGEERLAQLQLLALGANGHRHVVHRAEHR